MIIIGCTTSMGSECWMR